MPARTTVAGSGQGPSPSPKQPQTEGRKDWYPYYAGFSAAFVRRTLAAHLNSPQSVLDPWNGSGTTTSVAAEASVSATGIDLNPAMTVIAKARLHPTNRADDAMIDARRVATAIQGSAGDLEPRDPLLQWFQPAAARAIRAATDSIAQIATGGGAERTGASVRRAFLTAAVMATARDLLVSFRSRNPSWLSMPPSHRHRLSPSRDQIHRAFLSRCCYLEARLRIPNAAASRKVTLQTGPLTSLTGRRRWDACLTSPPYATRVDYVRGTAPELAVLGITAEAQDELRRAMTGTPLVKGRVRGECSLRSQTALTILSDVSSHPSHGSANYYAPWLSNYFEDIDDSLRRVSAAVRAKGRIAVVVQDSHYKEIHINLQDVIAEVLSSTGRSLIYREDYRAPHLMSRLKAHSRPHKASREIHESLLVFQ